MLPRKLKEISRIRNISHLNLITMNWLDDFDNLMREKAAIVYHQHKPTDP